MRRFLAGVLAWVALTSACTSQLDHMDKLVLSEGITDESIAPLVKAIRASSKETVLSVDTEGGDSRAALELGQAMFDHGNVTVNVDRICMSACAQYILPAAKKININEGALIVFHQSPKWLIAHPLANARQKAEIYKFSIVERKFYQQLKIDIERLELAQLTLGRRCWLGTLAPNRSDIGNLGVINSFDAVFIDKSLLVSFGFPFIEGYWPKGENLILAKYREATRRRFAKISFVTQLPKTIDEKPTPRC